MVSLREHKVRFALRQDANIFLFPAHRPIDAICWKTKKRFPNSLPAFFFHVFLSFNSCSHILKSLRHIYHPKDVFKRLLKWTKFRYKISVLEMLRSRLLHFDFVLPFSFRFFFFFSFLFYFIRPNYPLSREREGDGKQGRMQEFLIGDGEGSTLNSVYWTCLLNS